MSCNRELSRQLLEALAGASYPIRNRSEFLAALPQGADTVFPAGSRLWTAADLEELLSPRDFLFTNSRQIAGLIGVRSGHPGEEDRKH